MPTRTPPTNNALSASLVTDDVAQRVSSRLAVHTILAVIRQIGRVDDRRLIEMSAVLWSAAGMSDDEIALRLRLASAASTAVARSTAIVRVRLLQRAGAIRLRRALDRQHPDIAAELDELFDIEARGRIAARRSSRRHWMRALHDVGAVPELPVL